MPERFQKKQHPVSVKKLPCRQENAVSQKRRARVRGPVLTKRAFPAGSGFAEQTRQPLGQLFGSDGGGGDAQRLDPGGMAARHLDL